MSLRYIFIDIDNTLLDFDEHVRSTMREGFSRFGLKSYEPYMYDVFTQENNALWRSLERGEIDFDELVRVRWNSIFRALGIEYDGPEFEKYFRASLNESAIEVDGAHELLERLSRRFTLCAASNGPEHQQKNRLRLAGMDGFFSQCFISEALGASKPSPAFFDAAFASLPGVSPDECLMLGDSLTSDIAGGKAYGMKTCYFRRPGARESAEPDITVLSLAEAADKILASAGAE